MVEGEELYDDGPYFVTLQGNTGKGEGEGLGWGVGMARRGGVGRRWGGRQGRCVVGVEVGVQEMREASFCRGSLLWCLDPGYA